MLVKKFQKFKKGSKIKDPFFFERGKKEYMLTFSISGIKEWTYIRIKK